MTFAAAQLAPGATRSIFTEARFALRKAGRLFGLYLQDAMAYRAVALIWIMTDTVPMLIQPLLWMAAFHGRATVGGLAASQITAYYLVLLGVTNLVQCHQMWEIAADMKEGRFSAYLLRPFSYGVMNYLSFVSWRLMRTVMFLPIFGAALLLYGHTLRLADCHPSPAFFVTLILGHLVSFSITYAFALLAFYFVETRSLYNMWYMVLIIFSGQLAPLSLFPPLLRQIAIVLPFRYTIAIPTDVFLGRLTAHEIAQAIVLQIVWIVAGWAVARVLWTNGIRRFTGVGL